MTTDVILRFLDKRHRESSDPAACWIWDASRSTDGYGHMRVDGVLVQAHRLAYRMFVGPIPGGLTLDHLCRVRHCVNPFHLEPVTNEENIRRGTAGQWLRDKTACPHGHPYDEANTHHTRRGSRACRACARERAAARRSARHD